MHAPKPEASSQILKKIVMIGVPVCMGSLAVNLSGFIDMMTVTGRLDDVMNTAPQALLSGFGELIPQIEVTNQTAHNYLYGAYTGKAEVIANLVPGTDRRACSQRIASSGGELCKKQPSAHPEKCADGASHDGNHLYPGRIGNQCPVRGDLPTVLWL